MLTETKAMHKSPMDGRFRNKVSKFKARINREGLFISQSKFGSLGLGHVPCPCSLPVTFISEIRKHDDFIVD